MSTWLLCYCLIAGALLVTALPVIAQCIHNTADPNDSWWNHRAAALWIGVILGVCLLWPLVPFALLVAYLAQCQEDVIR